jgi:hypothetical protein
MPAFLPIPEGLEIPEGETFDLVTTYTVEDGQLYPVAVDGLPFEGATEEEEAEPEMEAEAPEAPEEAEQAPASPDSFMSAIERAMSKPQR